MWTRTSVCALLLICFLSVTTVCLAGHDDAQKAIKRGNEKVAKEQYAEAIREYGRVPKSAGEHYATARYNIGVCYYELWRAPEAVVEFEAAIAAHPNGHYLKALYALGIALEDLKRWAEAARAYRRVLEISHGGHIAAYYRLGLLDAREGKYESASTLFREAIKQSQDQFPTSHNNLGVMLSLLGRHREAEREFEIALEQTGGKYEDALHNLAVCRSRRTSASVKELALTFK